MSKKVEDAGKIVDDLNPVIPDDDKDPGIPEGFSADEWGDLSDDERAGILDDGEDDEPGTIVDDKDDIDLEALAKIAAEGDTEEDTTGEKPDNAADNDTRPALATFEVIDDEEAPRLPTIPLEVSNEVPADLKAKIDELAAKFDDGEMSVREYTDQRDSLNREVWQRNMQAGQEVQAAKTWEAEQNHFLQKNTAYLEDSLRGKALLGMLDAAVKTLANDEANAGKSGYQILQMAHKEVASIIGTTPKQVDPGKDDGKGKKPAAAKPDIKTLSDAPASSANLTEDPFAAVDRLEGEAYEAALERMTPDQAKAYRARA